MKKPPPLIEQFLAQQRIAIAGMSKKPESVSRLIAQKLRSSGYDVVGLHPTEQNVEGVACYPNIAAIPDGVDAVMITTSPSNAVDVAHDAVANNIRHIWFHRSFGDGSYSQEAEMICRDHGVEPITKGCPMMWVAPVDLAHRCMRMLVGGS